ncbi:MAG: renalase [Kiritimatiellia bacterium]|jgi:renalase
MQVKVIIIGAGISGLAAARHLTEAGCKVSVLDKGRGVGGRMATRRLPLADGRTGQADHGAQFFTVRDKRFQDLVDTLQTDDQVTEWCRGFSEDDGHRRFRGTLSMNAVAKHLATGLEIHREQRVCALRHMNTWLLETESGEAFQGDQILLTAPVPQAIQLLTVSGIAYPSALDELRYTPCLAVLANLDGPSGLPFPGVRLFKEGPVEWMADNHVKGISEIPTLTLHASPDFSAKHFERDRDAAGNEMIRTVQDELTSRVVAHQVHGWRYSRPLQVFPQRSLQVAKGLFLAGDGFGDPPETGETILAPTPRIESAWLSGLHAAEQLLATL